MTAVLLIPMFNSERTIAETLSSVQAQQGLSRLKKVVVSDDASTDRCVEAAHEAWKTPGVPLEIRRSEVNGGERINTNLALAALEPDVDWILFLHADDLAADGWLEALFRHIGEAEERVASICTSWFDLSEDGSLSGGENDRERCHEAIVGSVEAVANTLRRGCWWHLSGAAIRRRALLDVGLFVPDMPQYGDWEWLLACLERGWTILYVPRALVLYRRHSNSVSAVSFSSSRDLREASRLLLRFGYSFSLRQKSRFAGTRVAQAARRIVKFLVRADVRRAREALEAGAGITVAWVRSIRHRTAGSARA